MSVIKLLVHLSSFLVAHLFISGVVSTTFTITNKCNYTVWPGILSAGGSAYLSTTGFSLEKNESKTLTAPASWSGRLWGRTYCTEDSSGNFSCITGDCGSGKLECSGSSGVPPVTFAEFTLRGDGGLDYFDVSLVDGFNLPLLVVPSHQNCTSIGCLADLNESCPSELRVTTSTEGKTVGCKSACLVTSLSMFCCTGTNNTPDTCKPSLYSLFFKNTCPQAYSYAYDDNNSTFRCASTDYQVTFCPGNTTVITKNNSRPSPGEIAPIPPPEIRPDTTSRRHWVPIIAGIVGGVLAIISFVVIIVWRVRLSKSNDTEEDVEDDYVKLVPGMPVRFSYEDLRVATNDFKETLGRGGFGSVFKGVLPDGTGIAVKRLDKLGQGKRAFLAEVETIGSVHHFNLVRLIGFCAEKSYRLLVYEYMSNSSLDNWIFKKIQGSSLDWQTRKKIILDIAKGLTYLHEECRQTIMHLDIKPQNILLDPNFNAKISDFGLSKLIDREMSQVQLPMRGTPGYLAPEWHQALGRITVKVDVYSFGIVLLEVVCARRSVDHSQPEPAFHLLRMLQNKAEYILEFLDEYMQSDKDEIIRMIKIAAWCLQDDPEKRPLMSTVVKVLEGVMEVDSNLVYKFSHALAPPPVADNYILSAPPPASVLSNPR
ncbi:PR5-like receptor kinase [Populus alba]|uniref:PR5-like receptor kinase n=1 Tax=Populus alba TaxID=43335 RepID=UPI00158A4DD8|nr:PR5-like receptor kinase [Populus alba]